MQFIAKLVVTLAVILFCTYIGKRLPSLAGLIATMPLTGLLVLVWLYAENREDHALLTNYTAGALWGTIPSILFFTTAYVCFKKGLPFPIILAGAFSLWLLGAFIHQWFLK